MKFFFLNIYSIEEEEEEEAIEGQNFTRKPIP